VERSEDVSAPDAPLTFAFLTVPPFIDLGDGGLLFLTWTVGVLGPGSLAPSAIYLLTKPVVRNPNFPFDPINLFTNRPQCHQQLSPPPFTSPQLLPLILLPYNRYSDQRHHQLRAEPLASHLGSQPTSHLSRATNLLNLLIT
jgi:hypothetical protein